MGKSSISMAMFNSYVKLPEGTSYKIHEVYLPRRKNVHPKHPVDSFGESRAMRPLVSCMFFCWKTYLLAIYIYLHKVVIFDSYDVYVYIYIYIIHMMYIYIIIYTYIYI